MILSLSFGLLILAADGMPKATTELTRSNNHQTTIDNGDSACTLLLTEVANAPVQAGVVRTTGGADTTGWVLIAIVHGPDAELIREGQRVRAFSINSRRRVHLARVTRVTRQQGGVRVEATLAARVLGVSTRYVMEIVTDPI